MSHKGGEMFQMESLRLSINEHMASVREEISYIVNERLSSVEQFMCSLFQREIETLVETLLERRWDTLEHRSKLRVDVNATEDFLHLPVCQEEVSPEQQESLVQEEPERHIKEEQEEIHQRPEEADKATLTLLAVKIEGDDEIRDTEPEAGTSSKRMKTQADVEDCGASQPISDDQLRSALCSESGAEASDDWEAHSKSRRTGKKIFMCKVCGKSCIHRGHLNYHMSTHTGEKPFACIVCGKGCGRGADLKVHMMIHTGDKRYTCTVCGKGCVHKGHLNYHMRSHTGERPFKCPVCGKGFIQRSNLKVHMLVHTREKLLHEPRPEFSLIGDTQGGKF